MMYRFFLSLSVVVFMSSFYVLASDADESTDSSSDSAEGERKSCSRKSSKASQPATAPVVQADTVSRVTTYLWCQVPGRKYRTIVEASIQPDDTLAEPLLSYAKADQTNYFSKAVNECAKCAADKTAKSGEDGDYLLRDQRMLRVAKKYNIEVMQGAKDSAYQEVKNIMTLYRIFLKELEADPAIQQLHPELQAKRTRRQRRVALIPAAQQQPSIPQSTTNTTSSTATLTSTATSTSGTTTTTPSSTSQSTRRNLRSSKSNGKSDDYYRTAFELSEVATISTTTTTTAGALAAVAATSSASLMSPSNEQTTATTTFTSFPDTVTHEGAMVALTQTQSKSRKSQNSATGSDTESSSSESNHDTEKANHSTPLKKNRRQHSRNQQFGLSSGDSGSDHADH